MFAKLCKAFFTQPEKIPEINKRKAEFGFSELKDFFNQVVINT